MIIRTTENTSTSTEVCAQCGAPLAADGLVDGSRLGEGVTEESERRSLVEDRDDVQRRLAREQVQLEAHTRLGDEDAIVQSNRRLENYAERIQTIDALLGEITEYHPPREGACEGCGTVFRKGRPNVDAAESIRREHAERAAQLQALQEEMAVASKRIASGVLDDKRKDHTERRIASISESIEALQHDIGRDTPQSSSIRAFVTGGRRKRGQRDSARGESR